MKTAGRYIGLMVIFTVVGLVEFTGDVRPVQVLGLFATGAVFGVALANFILMMKARRKTE